MGEKEGWISRKGKWQQLKNKMKRLKTSLKWYTILEPSLVAFDQIFSEVAMEDKGLPKNLKTKTKAKQKYPCNNCISYGERSKMFVLVFWWYLKILFMQWKSLFQVYWRQNCSFLRFSKATQLRGNIFSFISMHNETLFQKKN